MLAAFLNFLAKLFSDSFEAWLKDRNDRAEAEKAGALAQAARTETDADALIAAARAARASVGTVRVGGPSVALGAIGMPDHDANDRDFDPAPKGV